MFDRTRVEDVAVPPAIAAEPECSGSTEKTRSRSSAAAEAIAGEMGRTLLLAWSGETFALSATPIWVRPVAVALSVQHNGFPA